MAASPEQSQRPLQEVVIQETIRPIISRGDYEGRPLHDSVAFRSYSNGRLRDMLEMNPPRYITDTQNHMQRAENEQEWITRFQREYAQRSDVEGVTMGSLREMFHLATTSQEPFLRERNDESPAQWYQRLIQEYTQPAPIQEFVNVRQMLEAMRMCRRNPYESLQDWYNRYRVFSQSGNMVNASQEDTGGDGSSQNTKRESIPMVLAQQHGRSLMENQAQIPASLEVTDYIKRNLRLRRADNPEYNRQYNTALMVRQIHNARFAENSNLRLPLFEYETEEGEREPAPLQIGDRSRQQRIETFLHTMRQLPLVEVQREIQNRIDFEPMRNDEREYVDEWDRRLRETGYYELQDFQDPEFELVPDDVNYQQKFNALLAYRLIYNAQNPNNRLPWPIYQNAFITDGYEPLLPSQYQEVHSLELKREQKDLEKAIGILAQKSDRELMDLFHQIPFSNTNVESLDEWIREISRWENVKGKTRSIVRKALDFNREKSVIVQTGGIIIIGDILVNGLVLTHTNTLGEMVGNGILGGIIAARLGWHVRKRVFEKNQELTHVQSEANYLAVNRADEVEQLTQDNTAKDTQLQHVQQELDSKNERIEVLEDENQDLIEKLKTATDESAQLQRLEVQQRQIEKLNRDLLQANTRNSQITTEKERLESENRGLKVEKSDLAETITTLAKQNASFEELVETAKISNEIAAEVDVVKGNLALFARFLRRLSEVNPAVFDIVMKTFTQTQRKDITTIIDNYGNEEKKGSKVSIAGKTQKKST